MKLDTKWPADSVEFCPHPRATDILVCGTYFLCDTKSDVVPNVVEGAEEPEVTPSPQRRRGQLIVLNVSDASTQPRMFYMIQSKMQCKFVFRNKGRTRIFCGSGHEMVGADPSVF